jgi:hypothetical protein
MARLGRASLLSVIYLTDLYVVPNYDRARPEPALRRLKSEEKTHG